MTSNENEGSSEACDTPTSAVSMVSPPPPVRKDMPEHTAGLLMEDY